jgi:hypothetical protein
MEGSVTGKEFSENVIQIVNFFAASIGMFREQRHEKMSIIHRDLE